MWTTSVRMLVLAVMHLEQHRTSLRIRVSQIFYCIRISPPHFPLPRGLRYVCVEV